LPATTGRPTDPGCSHGANDPRLDAGDRAPDSLAAGVLTTAAAVRKFGRGHVRHQLASRRWQRPARGVVWLHNGPITESQRHWVALLVCPPGQHRRVRVLVIATA